MSYQSQSGEDKFLEPLLPEKGWFVDVGAWNGVYLSNTYFLVEKGWNGLEIEADRGKVLEMKKTIPDRIYRIARKVNPFEIDEVIGMFPEIPRNFDLLSIDIDTFDYWVWKNMKNYEPKFVIIESNGRKGHYIQPPKMNYKGIKGSSPKSIIKLAKSKGYKLIWDKANYIFQK